MFFYRAFSKTEQLTDKDDTGKGLTKKRTEVRKNGTQKKNIEDYGIHDSGNAAVYAGIENAPVYCHKHRDAHTWVL